MEEGEEATTATTASNTTSTTQSIWEGERIDCENIEDVTMRMVPKDRPSFVTVLLRFYGNVIVDIIKAIFE